MTDQKPPSSSQQFYERLYQDSNYRVGITESRIRRIRSCVLTWMQRVGIGPEDRVLEVGAGHGTLHDIHPRWRGVEYSATAISQGKQRYGETIALRQGDATSLDEPDSSFHFVFTIATLEHVPEIEKAFAELERVLAPGGTLLLAPAWNCRPWTVAKLQQRPFADLSVADKLSKATIPLRENLLFRTAAAFPARLCRELLSAVRPAPLHYKRLRPNFDLINKYGHIADDDAFISMDAHAAIKYLSGRGLRCLSHPTAWRRMACRGEPVVVQRPSNETHGPPSSNS